MWLLFVGELRRRWLEHVLGALAIALVIAALVANDAVSLSAQDSVHELAHRLGRNMLVLPGGADLAAFHGQRFGAETLPDTTPATLQASEAGEHIRSVEARLYGEVEVNGARLIVVGQDAGWPALGDVQPAALGGEAARAAGLSAGQAFAAGGEVFSVLQVTDAAPDGLDRAVFMPLATAQRLLDRPGRISALRLGGCWCRIDIATLGRKVEHLLPGTRAITVVGTLEAQKGSVATMQRHAGLIRAAGLSVVAAIVATLALSQLRRRRREIGLLVAIGAPPRKVRWLFTLQGAAVGALGALLGWAAAFPLTHEAGAALLGASISPPAGALAPVLALAVLVSTAAAHLMARQAAALDPTVVIRES
ncbi:MAG: FtsX-like permease family protein [Anaeromyxobacter sp.]